VLRRHGRRSLIAMKRKLGKQTADMGKPDLSPYRWVIEILLVLALFSRVFAWLAPAPILGPIIRSLNLTLSQAGLLISVIALCIGIFSMLGAVVMERLGARGAMLTGVWVLAVGEIVSGYCTTFPVLLACRVVEGVGCGMTIGPPGAFLMQWFGEHEWPYINMANAVCASMAITAVFSTTAPIFVALGSSWMLVLRYYGLGCASVALLWTILGRERSSPLVEIAATTGAQPSSVISEVIRMRDVILLAIAMFGQLWSFQLYTAFLPQYFHAYRGLGLTEASALTAVLPTAGMFASLLGGLGTGFTGLRKPFLWPVAICTLIGCAGAVLVPDLIIVRLALVLIGIGVGASGAAIPTLVMELPGMTPEKMGTALAFVWSVAYSGAFVSPFLGGAIAGAIGLKVVMLSSLAFLLMQIVAFYLLPETGPGRAQVRVAAA
jgi:MFS family permease